MQSDAYLIKAYVAHQDPEAFAQLVERYAALVHAACRRVCGNSTDADDAAQEAFIAFARHAGRIRTSLPAWLHRVATRCAWHQMSRWPRRERAVAEPITSETTEDDLTQDQQRLDSDIAALPTPLRTVIVLRFLEGRDQQTIATELGISQATVSRRIERAVGILRMRLQPTTVASLAVLGPPQAVAPHLLTKLRRIAITPPPMLPTLERLLAKVLVPILGLGLVLGLVRGHVLHVADVRSFQEMAAVPAPRSGPVVVAEAPDASGAKPEAVLERRITRTARGLSIDQAVEILNGYMYPADGEFLCRMHGVDRLESANPIDILADHASLRSILNDLATHSLWRWREKDGIILLDFPLEQRRLRAMEKALSTALAGHDVAGVRIAAVSLAQSLDVEAYVDVLRDLADPSVDHAADQTAALQSALVNALESVPPVLMRSMITSEPLALFSADPTCRRSGAAAWRRAVNGQATMTPFLCALPGMLHLQDLAGDLVRVVEAPASIARDLDPHSPLQALALENLRRFALWSLGRIADHTQVPLITEQLRHAQQVDVIPCLDALGALHSPVVASAVLDVDPANDVWVEAEQYTALADSAPKRLHELLSPPHAQSTPGWDLPLAEGIVRCGYPQRPTIIALRRLLSMTAPDRHGFASSIMLPSLLRLPHEEVISALQPAATDNEYQASIKQMCRAYLGVDADISALLTTLHHPGRVADWWTLMELMTVLAPDEAATRIAPWRSELRGQATGQTLSLICSFIPAELPNILARRSAPGAPAPEPAFVMQMLSSHQPEVEASLRLVLARDPRQVLALMVSSRQPVSLPLREAVLQLLAASDPAVRGLAATVLAMGFEHLDAGASMQLLDCLEGLPLADIDEDLPSLLSSIHGARIVSEPEETRMVRVELRWLKDAPREQARQAAAYWFGHEHIRDMRPIRQEALSGILQCLSHERSTAVRTELLHVLDCQLNQSVSPSWDEYVNENSALGGLQDDHASIRALDALRPRLLRAMHADLPAHLPGQTPTVPHDF